MGKFIKLCSCEHTKIMKKKSTKVMFILLILALFASAALTALTNKVTNFANDMVASETGKEHLQTTLDSFKHELENSNNLDEASKNELRARIDTYQFAFDNDINSSLPYWKNDAVFVDLYGSIIQMYNNKSMALEDETKKAQDECDKIRELVKNDDFNGYISFNKENLKSQLEKGIVDQKSYDAQMYVLDLKEKYQIGKEYNSEDAWKVSVLSDIESSKVSLYTGIDQIGGYRALTEETYKELEDSIKINEYRLEHNMAPYMTGSTMVSFGSNRKVYDYMAGSLMQFVLTIMVIIIAGTSVASEMTKGTIKFWSFTPYKRWKILLSKIVVSTFILVATTIVISLISTLVGNIFFGAGNAQGYLYVSNGNVHEINYVLFSVLYNLVGAIEIFVFMILALMLSTVTRNAATAVGISLAAYLGGSTIMQIINLFVKSDWIKFIPFNNLSLASRIFKGDISNAASSMISSLTGNITVGFSLAVLGVCVVLMLVTMFDSFRKRDIL